MRNIRLTLSYDGTDFFGWQTQSERSTVQETLEKAIAELTGEERVRVNASGRTDTGVHAIGQVVNFRTEAKYPAEVFLRAVNARLPADVVITEAEEVSEAFDANRDARRKLYRYVLHDGDVETASLPNANGFYNNAATSRFDGTQVVASRGLAGIDGFSLMRRIRASSEETQDR